MWPPKGEPTIHNSEGSAKRLLDSIGVDSRTPHEKRRDFLQETRAEAYSVRSPFVHATTPSDLAVRQQRREEAEAAAEMGPSQSIGLNLPG